MLLGFLLFLPASSESSSFFSFSVLLLALDVHFFGLSDSRMPGSASGCGCGCFCCCCFVF